MTITQIKEQLVLPSLDLNTANDKDGNPTQWMRAWDNNRRIAVSLHKELLKEIQADLNLPSLGLQMEKKQTAKGEYTAYRIVKYKPAEVTL